MKNIHWYVNNLQYIIHIPSIFGVHLFSNIYQLPYYPICGTICFVALRSHSPSTFSISWCLPLPSSFFIFWWGAVMGPFHCTVHPKPIQVLLSLLYYPPCNFRHRIVSPPTPEYLSSISPIKPYSFPFKR